MLACPRGGNQAEYVAGQIVALVWHGACADLIEVGDLDLRAAAATVPGGMAATR